MFEMEIKGEEKREYGSKKCYILGCDGRLHFRADVQMAKPVWE